jgi:hypothetical protein
MRWLNREGKKYINNISLDPFAIMNHKTKKIKLNLKFGFILDPYMLINVSAKRGCQKSFGRLAWSTFGFQWYYR